MSEAAQWEVLLVEDSAADIHLIEQALAECGKHIHLRTITNGGEALTFLRKEAPFTQTPSPALIISDLNLPGLDGYELLEELRRLPAHQQTPVVIFSGAYKDLTEPRCLQLGANQYVQKPSDLHSFFAAIAAIVDTWLTHDGPQ